MCVVVFVVCCVFGVTWLLAVDRCALRVACCVLSVDCCLNGVVGWCRVWCVLRVDCCSVCVVWSSVLPVGCCWLIVARCALLAAS